LFYGDQNFYQYSNTHQEEFTQQTLVPHAEEPFRIHVPLDGMLKITPEGLGDHELLSLSYEQLSPDFS